MSTLTKIVALVLVLLGLLFGFMAVRLLHAPAPQPAAPPQARPEAAAAGPQHPVVVAAQHIVAGQTLTASMLKTVQWPAQPSRGYADAAPLLGRTLRFDIAAGDPVLRDMLASGLATYLEEGERAISIPVDDASGADAGIKPGDRVDVFFTLNRNGEVGDSQARLLLSRVRVLAYGLQSVDGPRQPAQQSSAVGRREAPAAVRSAMLAVPLDDVNKLLLATRRGALQLVLRNPSDDRMPDVALFPPPEPVLRGRKDLTAEQRSALGREENLAYAGASLPQLAGSPQDGAQHEARPGSPGRGPALRSPRTVQVIRGDKAERVAY